MSKLSLSKMLAFIPFSQHRQSYVYLTKWMLFSVAAGFTASVIIYCFSVSLIELKRLFSLIPSGFFLRGIIGALIVGGIFYRIEPDAAGEGMPSYMRGLRLNRAILPFKVTIFKFLSALITLSAGGSGGVVGPLGRVCAGIMTTGDRFFESDNTQADENRRMSAICGMAAAIGAIFHSAIGGGIFAVEILQRSKLGYKDLFPSILASSSAVYFCKVFGWGGFYSLPATDSFMDVGIIGWLLLVSFASGITGGLFTSLYARVSRIIKREEGVILPKVLAGMLLSALLTTVLNPNLQGTSNEFFTALAVGDLDNPIITGVFSGKGYLIIVLMVMLILKALTNAITVGSGMSAGFTGPAALIGMMIGAIIALMAGITPGDASYFALLAAGFAAMLASSMNVPLAAAVMSVEIFGLQYSLPGGMASVIAFQVMRHRTIYDYALAGHGVGIYDKE